MAKAMVFSSGAACIVRSLRPCRMATNILAAWRGPRAHVRFHADRPAVITKNKPRWYPQQQKIWETWQELVNNYIKFQPWWQTTPEAAPKFPFDLSDDSPELFDF